MSPARQRRASPRSRARWVALGLGILLAAGGLWVVLSREPRAPDAPPLDDIDPASRQRLEDVLRRADDEEARR